MVPDDNRADEFQEFISSYDWYRAYPYGVITYSGVDIVHMSSGFGDGIGPGYKLMAGNECIGMELDFIGEADDN